MKKSLATCALALLAWGWAQAGPVTPERAATVAKAFWSSSLNGKGDLNAVGPLEGWPYDGIHLFTHTGGGFVMVAGDDASRPILGYSASGRLDPGNLPVQLRAWLDGYQQQLDYLREHGGTPYPADAEAWACLESGSGMKDGEGVGPLLTTRWDQSDPYNDLCPAGTATGCAATAQAQLMKYWNHPAFGTGSHSYTHDTYGQQAADFAHTLYDWDHMPDMPNWASSSQERLAVATLMYHCGVSLEMHYAPAYTGGSSALGLVGMPGYSSIDNSLQNYFGYSRQMQVIMRDAGYTNEQWRAALIAELDQRHPIVYCGAAEAGGHGFVCDGYDSRGYLHFNFGWSGLGDGYYTVDSISPGVGGIGGNGTYTFNLNNTALLGAVPVYEIRVSDTLVNYGRDGGTDSLLFGINEQVDAPWSVESSATWLTMDEATFTRAGWVYLHAEPITDGTLERTATLTFRQGSESATVRVTQTGYSNEDLCPVTVVMESTRGNGWQGNAHLTLESAGGYIFGTARLTDSQRDSVEILVPSSEVLSVWHSGGGTDRYINYYVRNQHGENVVEAEYAYRTGGTHLIERPCASVGIDQATQSSQWTVYPNPATHQLHIGAEGLLRAELRDMTGRIVATTTSHTMNIEPLPAGAYILSITTATDHTARRIIKQ